MKLPNSLSVRRGPICRQYRVLTDISAIIIAGLDCVKPENYGFFRVHSLSNRNTGKRSPGTCHNHTSEREQGTCKFKAYLLYLIGISLC